MNNLYSNSFKVVTIKVVVNYEKSLIQLIFSWLTKVVGSFFSNIFAGFPGQTHLKNTVAYKQLIVYNYLFVN